MADVICPLCGCFVDARGLKSHQNSYRCIAQRTYQENTKQGLVIFKGLRENSPFLTLLPKLFKRDITGYHPGSIAMSGYFKMGYWGPEWLHPLWELYQKAPVTDKKTLLEMYQKYKYQEQLPEVAQNIAKISDKLEDIILVMLRCGLNKKTRKLFYEKLCGGAPEEAIAIAYLSGSGN